MLLRLLEEILDFVRTENDKLFLVLVFTKERRIAQIESYHQRITALIHEFQVSTPNDLTFGPLNGFETADFIFNGHSKLAIEK